LGLPAVTTLSAVSVISAVSRRASVTCSTSGRTRKLVSLGMGCPGTLKESRSSGRESVISSSPPRSATVKTSLADMFRPTTSSRRPEIVRCTRGSLIERTMSSSGTIR
jgi:hypothetical protein